MSFTVYFIFRVSSLEGFLFFFFSETFEPVAHPRERKYLYLVDKTVRLPTVCYVFWFLVSPTLLVNIPVDFP